jgi:peptidoglycan/LPS O-acetylase OafA/YrhL
MRRHFGDAAIILLGLLFLGLAHTKGWTALINPVVKPLQGMYAFLFGMLVPTAGRAFAKRMSGRAAAGTAATTILLFFISRKMFGISWGMHVEAWAVAVFIALLVYGPQLRAYRALDFGIVRFYGKISYSFYLLHPLTLIVIWKMPRVIDGWIAAGIPPAILTLALWLATTAAVTPIAMASYQFVELPAMQLWRRVNQAGAEPTGATGNAKILFNYPWKRL